MTVTIESAGSHFFDLGHLRRQGGEELVEKILHKAGFTGDAHWRIQVQKKLFCNSETPPLRVVDSPKKWAVYLKIKPGDNNSCHYCSLLMPDGMQGEDVYHSLKKVENELDRNWKNTEREKVAVAQAPADFANGESKKALDSQATVTSKPREEESSMKDGTTKLAEHHRHSTRTSENGADKTAAGLKAPTAPLPPPLEKTRGTLKGWIGNLDKTRLVLRAIQEINAGTCIHNSEHFVEMLCQKLGWEEVNRYQVGGVFTSLVRKDYIVRLLRGSTPIGYELSDEGWTLIKDFVEAPPPADAAPAPIDFAEIIRSFGPFAQQFVQAHTRLEQIAARESELNLELEMLRLERDEICKFLENRDLQEAVHKLLPLQAAAK